MTQSQLGDFDDIVFALEVNLHEIRRELVELLDEYENGACFVCDKIRCSCMSESSLFCSTTISIVSSDSACPRDRDRSMGAFYNVAPPPETLPKPKWPVIRNIEPKNLQPTAALSIKSWVTASVPQELYTSMSFPVPDKLEDDINYSWPPFPSSIWSAQSLKRTLERENNISHRHQMISNSVEEFFRFFNKRAVCKTGFDI